MGEPSESDYEAWITTSCRLEPVLTCTVVKMFPTMKFKD